MDVDYWSLAVYSTKIKIGTPVTYAHWNVRATTNISFSAAPSQFGRRSFAVIPRSYTEVPH